MGKETKYWRGLEELANNPEFQKHQQNEFVEEIPVEKFLGNEKLGETSTSRRDFLKFVGFSVTAASLAACETPVNKAIPYVIKPEEVTPGVANWYASTYYDGHDYASILVKTREGRPIKIEGNDMSGVTMGATNARVQASVLSLYDSSRLTGPVAKKSPATWASVDKDITTKLGEIAATGGNIRLLSSTIISPSTKQVIADFIAKYPTAKHVMHDAVSYSGIIKGNWNSFEHAAVPSYYFDRANIVVSIGADFLGNWLSPIEFSKQYGKRRKLSKESSNMSKHYQFEANMSLTGSNADVRVPVRPSQYGNLAASLYNALAAIAGLPSVVASKVEGTEEVIKTIAKELLANKKNSLVICGSNDPATQMIINAINTIVDSYENTIDLRDPSYLHQGTDESFIALVEEMKNGKVDALITYNTNPVYTSPEFLSFGDAYKKVKLRISLSDKLDETADLSDYVCPDHHYLESWNDFNPKSKHYSIAQPTIAPIFSKATNHEGTRAAQESLLVWADNTMDYHAYMQKQWESAVFPMQNAENNFTAFWNKSVQDGIFQLTTGVPVESEKDKQVAAERKTELKKNSADVVVPANGSEKMDLAAAAAVVNKYDPKDGSWELALYEKVSMGNGNQANNPWLQELPDPVTKITWDNYITMSPIDMKENGYKLMLRQDREASVINVTIGGSIIALPVIPQPGQARKTIGIALGYGRTKAGALSEKAGVVGQNAFPLVQVANNTFYYHTADIQLSGEIKTEEIAGTQVHHTIMGRNLIRETSLEAYKKNPRSANDEEVEEQLTTHVGKKDPELVTLWDNHERPGHKWGMVIDLNSCIGCAACVVSCTAENNVAVVGKDQVKRTREMHWIRIDRYYTSDMTEEVAEEKGIGAVDMYLEMENPNAENPRVIFQPVMCQHCNHAPCETVCPVIATNHSSEGLNQMTYNRCVGTRYCANNCPFKVRRFNWYNLNENGMFAGLNPAQDDLGKMVLNPDVVVRSRGVMEKCSMCVQRIQGGKLEAKKAMRKLQDGEIKTACQQACPTNAIIFGDVHDEASQVSGLRKDERNYYMLHELNIQPTVSYMVKVRNADIEVAEVEKGGHEHKEVEKHEEKKES